MICFTWFKDKQQLDKCRQELEEARASTNFWINQAHESAMSTGALEQRVTSLEKDLIYQKALNSPPPPPNKLVEISSNEISQLIWRVCGSKTNTILADSSYKITTVPEMIRFLQYVKPWEMIWNTDYPDCDDFTRRIKGELVCPGWGFIPALEGRYITSSSGHSVFMTVLLDGLDDTSYDLFVIEGQVENSVIPASQVFIDVKPYLIYH